MSPFNINKLPQFTLKLLIASVISAFLIVCVFLGALNQARQASFNIDAIGRFVSAYRMIEGIQIESLSQLPDFHVLSPSKGFSFNSKDIQSGILGGYSYDMKYAGGGRYCISASPVGFLTPNIEFGIAEDEVLKVNKENADKQADSCGEVASWRWTGRVNDIITKEGPEYLR